MEGYGGPGGMLLCDCSHKSSFTEELVNFPLGMVGITSMP